MFGKFILLGLLIQQDIYNMPVQQNIEQLPFCCLHNGYLMHWLRPQQQALGQAQGADRLPCQAIASWQTYSPSLRFPGPAGTGAGQGLQQGVGVGVEEGEALGPCHWQAHQQ